MTSRSLLSQSPADHGHGDDDMTIAPESTPLRSASPLVIEEDEGLTSFLQRESPGLVGVDAPTSSAADPILRYHTQHHYNHGSYDNVISPITPITPVENLMAAQPVRLTPFIALLTITACISGLLFGYDTGVISSTLVSVGEDLGGKELSMLAQSLITSSTSLFALVASPPGGWMADAYGRRWVIVVADLLFIVGALLQSYSGSVVLMVVGRSIVGAGVGAASLVVPLYISELAPPEFRGRLVVVNNLFITGGQMVAYVIGWRLAAVAHGWRWMVGLGAVPAIAQLALLTFLPETPRWLVRAGRPEPARQILNRAYGAGSERVVEVLVRTIEREVLQEEEMKLHQAQRQSLRKNDGSLTSWRPDGWTELFGVGGHRRALIIAAMLQGLQQLCGFNSLMYFSATIFRQVGFRSPILASLSVAVTNFLFTLVSMVLIDRIGRRRILLLTIPFMVISLLLTAVAFSHMGGGTITSPGNETSPSIRSIIVSFMTRNDANANPSSPWLSEPSKAWPTLVLVSVILYVAFYATGLGAVPWQQSELFPLSVRSLGCGIATATNWGSNFVVGLTFLPLMQLITPSFTFALYAAVCAVGWSLVYRIYPETKGMGLEEVSGLLRDGWGVEESLKKRSR